MSVKLAIICPCYNEEDVLNSSASKLKSLYDNLISNSVIDSSSVVVFVNDGSKDSTWNIIKDLHQQNKMFKGIDLAFNSGHQFALLAGMLSVKDKVDAAITIDVDLQDDLSCIEKMINDYTKGYDVVYGVKTKRDSDGLMKRFTAKSFYKVQKLMGVDIIDNHADFRLVSNKVIKTLSQFHEDNLYLRGIIPSLGFKSSTVDDEISSRLAGKSKYSRKKMMKLATDGITSFTTVPIKIVLWIGLIFLLVAFINAIDIVVSLCKGTAEPGWSQIMLSIWFIGGIILVSLALIGIYIGRIYNEVKQRPHYIISEIVD